MKVTRTPELSREAVRGVLTQVQDPELHRDLVSLGMVKDIVIQDRRVAITVELTTPACPLKNKIGDDVKKAVREVWPDVEVQVEFGARVRKSGAAWDRAPVGEVKNVVLVASGKGGVGKSTVAVNLAFALHRLGAAVGLCDADVYGPSLQVMVKPEQEPEVDDKGRLVAPPRAHGVPLVSMGYLVDPDQPVIWRGPMLAGAALQLVQDVPWGPLDYLVVDLPPGTGDVQLSIAQKVRVSGAVIVSTPQDVALADVRRAKAMFDKVGIQTLGVVENMSFFVCDGCGKRHDIFDSGGAARAAGELGTPFLGALPIDPATREGADRGVPVVMGLPDSAMARAFVEIAGQLAARLAVLTAQQGAPAPQPEIVQ
jgi:ATP-binding protein involved in chromosome partitioning